MRSTWRLPAPRHPVRTWHEKNVILDFNGPQLVVLESEGALYLSVASDEDEGVIRWLRAPITDAENRELLAREKTVLECLRKPTILVVDTDEHGHSTAEYVVPFDLLTEDDLPLAGAFVPSDVVTHRRERE